MLVTQLRSSTQERQERRSSFIETLTHQLNVLEPKGATHKSFPKGNKTRQNSPVLRVSKQLFIQRETQHTRAHTHTHTDGCGIAPQGWDLFPLRPMARQTPPL